MVDTTKYVIDDILNSIVDEKPVDLQAALNSIMVDKAHDQIASMKTQLMQDMLSAQQPEDEEEQEFEDEPEGDEDNVEVEDADEDEADGEDEELDADEMFNDLADEEETDNQG